MVAFSAMFLYFGYPDSSFWLREYFSDDPGVFDTPLPKNIYEFVRVLRSSSNQQPSERLRIAQNHLNVMGNSVLPMYN
jgi:hypothetical protein